MPTPKTLPKSKTPASRTPPFDLACSNAFAAPQAADSGDLPGALTIPYGQWPHGPRGPREYDVLGKRMLLAVDQVFDHAGALAMANALAEARGKGHPGIPVYAGHPDAPEFAALHPDKAAIGWITAALANAGGLDLTIDWLKNPGRGFAFFSPYWQGPTTISAMPSGSRPGKAVTRVNRFRSLGLLNVPNIEDFRLPNAAADEPQPPTDEDTMPKSLLMLLGLPETATEEEAAAAIEKLQADLKDATDRLASTEPALANARKDRNDTLISAALANGQISGAEKGTWELRLANAFDAESKVLAALPRKAVKTAPVTGGGPADPAAANNREVILQLVNAAQKESPGLDFNAAWRKVSKARPELFKTPAPAK